MHRGLSCVVENEHDMPSKTQDPVSAPWSSRCILGNRVHAGKQKERPVRFYGITTERLCHQTT